MQVMYKKNFLYDPHAQCTSEVILPNNGTNHVIMIHWQETKKVAFSSEPSGVISSPSIMNLYRKSRTSRRANLAFIYLTPEYSYDTSHLPCRRRYKLPEKRTTPIRNWEGNYMGGIRYWLRLCHKTKPGLKSCSDTLVANKWGSHQPIINNTLCIAKHLSITLCQEARECFTNRTFRSQTFVWMSRAECKLPIQETWMAASLL